MAKFNLFQKLREEVESQGIKKSSINFIPFESNWREKLISYPTDFKEEYKSNLSYNLLSNL